MTQGVNHGDHHLVVTDDRGSYGRRGFLIALSDKVNVTYCSVTPCECHIAKYNVAICSPLRTAAVAKPRRRLWIVAYPHFNSAL